jgi:CCR4-NOT transcription complex subunit 1
MRNLILSAFPRNMRLPDPFTPNLKIDLLPEIHLSPRILSDFTVILENHGFKKELDQYLETSNTGVNNRFLNDLASKLKSEKSYNVPLVNALVLYIGTVTIMNGTPVHQGPAMEIYQYLLAELDSEGKYKTINVI